MPEPTSPPSGITLTPKARETLDSVVGMGIVATLTATLILQTGTVPSDDQLDLYVDRVMKGYRFAHVAAKKLSPEDLRDSLKAICEHYVMACHPLTEIARLIRLDQLAAMTPEQAMESTRGDAIHPRDYNGPCACTECHQNAV